MPSLLKEYAEFFRQFRARYETTGAILPSSRFLARALTRPLALHTRPVRILEVGPGTGPVTRRIVGLMRPEDRLDLVELNDQFVAILRDRLDSEPQFRAVAEQTRLHHCPIQEFRADKPYDFIISGLPLNNFSPELVEEIFDCFFRLLAPEGVLSYFEYMFLRAVRMRVGRRNERQRLRGVDQVVSRYLSRYRFRRDWVFCNVPPAWVQHLRRDG
ncbi:MAG: methyltransferase domain-containing protein [Planctomycetes bacterium]|nr:methyltransferase domain-containing protein [Planctomycetota bacterium]